MTPSHLHNRLLVLVLTALVLMPFAAFTATPEPQPSAPEQALPAAADTTASEDLPSLRHRYRHDATGVRARLGMCRRGGHGGPHGKGQHVDGAAGHGPGRGRHHRCPLDAPQENTP